MVQTVKSMMDAANAAVRRLSFAEAGEMMKTGEALVLDVRDGTEVAVAGKVTGAKHIPRGLLEFKVDPASPLFDKDFRFERPVLLYCASGGRSALAGKLLTDMGYTKVFNIGGFKDWVEAGGRTDKPD